MLKVAKLCAQNDKFFIEHYSIIVEKINNSLIELLKKGDF